MISVVFRWKPLLISILISFGAGGISALFTMNSMGIYESLNQPPLSPPSIVFPIVWAILYLLMGISAYLVYDSQSFLRKKALILYGVQLVFNILWPLFFFNLQWFWFSFVWLSVLVALVLAMVAAFDQVNKTAALLQLPYLLWLVFAGYLNFMIALNN